MTIDITRGGKSKEGDPRARHDMRGNATRLSRAYSTIYFRSSLQSSHVLFTLKFLPLLPMTERPNRERLQPRVLPTHASLNLFAAETRAAPSAIHSTRAKQPHHIPSPSQTTQRKPTSCLRQSSPEWYARSPLRTVTLQDDIKPPQPAAPLGHRRRGLDKLSTRDALSSALSSSSLITLLPKR